MIREPAKTDGIPKAIDEGAVHQMQSFMQHLVQLVLDGLVDREIAANAASNRHDFELALSQRAMRASAAAEAADRRVARQPTRRRDPTRVDASGLCAWRRRDHAPAVARSSLAVALALHRSRRRPTTFTVVERPGSASERRRSPNAPGRHRRSRSRS